MISIAIVLLVISAKSLHISHKQSTPKYNATNYLTDLESRQNQFIADMDLIKQQIAQINQTLDSSTMTSNQQLKTLSEGMADERDSLYNIQTTLYMPFEIEPCKPVNLTTAQRQQLQKQINAVNASLNNLKAKADQCPDCPQILVINQEIQKQYNYLRVIQATVQSDCLQRPYEFVNETSTGLVNIASSLYKDNLKATNWIYGSITEQDYKNYIFTQSTQYNLTSCPITRPYVDPTRKLCVVCAGTFNLGQRKCYPCPPNQHFNFPNLTCIDNPKQCPVGYVLNTTTSNCDLIICGEGLVLDNATNRCVSMCTGNQVYNKDTRKCEIPIVTCDPGYLYNITTKKCEVIVCPAKQVYDINLRQCIDSVANTVSLCPPDKPFWNSTGYKCQLCPDTAPLYNKNFNRCEACPINTIWNAAKSACQVQCQAGQVYNQTSKMCQSICQQGQLYNPVTKNCQIQCPTGQVYNSTTKQCQITCPTGQIYNSTTKQCQVICPAAQIFNSTTKQCQVICPQGQFYNTTAKGCQVLCPPNTFYNQTTQKCQISCMPGQLYNETSSICQIICPSGQVYNSATKTCRALCDGNFVFDGTQNKCICPAGFILNGTNCNPKVNCSEPTPVYNSVTNKCQQCPLATPIYANGKCTVCPSDRPNYSPKIKQCLQACPSAYFWNSTLFRCDMIVCNSSKPILNFKTGQCQTCPVGFYWADSQKTCKSNFTGQCPPDKPFYNSIVMACQGCPAQTLFNNQTGLCQYCPVGQHLDQSIGMCVVDQTCETNPSYCPTCPNGYSYNQVSGECQTSFCNTGYRFNNATGQCQKCPDGSFYNKTTLKCQSIICSGGYFNNQSRKCQACPTGSYPDPSGKSCNTCANGTYYSPSFGSCIKCINGSYFDSVSFQCLKCPEGTTYVIENKNCITITCNSNQYYSQTLKNCKIIPSCPPGQYYDIYVQSCRAYPTCADNQIFNNATKQCQLLPPCLVNQFFNKVTKKCQTITYLTSPNASNLIYAYNFTQYEKQYNTKRVSDPNARDCPTATPYYDRNAKNCVSCPSSNPYFNLHTNLCQSCGSVNYDSSKRQCESNSKISVDPTLQRLIMNII